MLKPSSEYITTREYQPPYVASLLNEQLWVQVLMIFMGRVGGIVVFALEVASNSLRWLYHGVHLEAIASSPVQCRIPP